MGFQIVSIHDLFPSMVTAFFRCLVIGLLLAGFFCGCQKAPHVSASAEPTSVNAMAPMDSETSNAELKKRREVLDDMIEGRISAEEFARAKSSDSSDRLSQVISMLGLPSLPLLEKKDQLEKDFLIAQFYFYERRFIEAAQLFSGLLDKRPGWLRARNLLARCFYFLGNVDRSFLELKYVITNHDGQAEELLDALFLMGAIALDSQAATEAQVEKGVGAWKTYLKLAPHSPLREKIQEGLALHEKKSDFNVAKNMASGNLKTDAMDALDSDDLLSAETKMRAAIKKFPGDEELEVALARIFVKAGRVSEALSEFKKIIARRPRSIIAHHYQGMAFMMSGDPQNAIQSWEKVLALDASYGEKFNLRGRILIAKNLMKKDDL